MNVKFPNSVNWKSFYDSYGLEFVGEVSDKGWINCRCVFHPNFDKDYKAAINIWSGNYKCWNAECQETSRKKLGYNKDSQIITPREFLILHEGDSEQSANEKVLEFRQNSAEDEPPIKLEKVYRPKKEWTTFVDEAAKRLSPTLDIVQEYCKSRGLIYDTLVKFKIGYVPEEGNNPEYLTVPYYYRDSVACIKGRTIDGRKSANAGAYSCLFNIDNALASQSKTVIIVEGETDCIYLTQLLMQKNINIPVIATPGSQFAAEWKRNLLGFERIVCIPQDDDAASGLVKGLMKCVPDKLDIIHLPFTARTTGKDVCDYCRQHDVTSILAQIGDGSTTKKKPLLQGEELFKMADVEIPYLIPNLLERGTKTLFVGEPKLGKTWIVLQIMSCLVNREPLFGIEEWTPKDDNLKVLLVEEEGSEYRLGERLKQIAAGDIKKTKNMTIIHRQNTKLDEETSFNKLLEAIIAIKPDCLILDPYAQLHNQDENSATGTQVILTALNKLLIANPKMAMIIIHHGTKSNAKTPRGSSALPGGVDLIVYLSKSTGYIRWESIGRDISIPDMSLTFDSSTGRHKLFDLGSKLSSDGEEENEEGDSDVENRKAVVVTAQIIKYIKRNQPAPLPQMKKDFAATIAYQALKRYLDQLTLDGVINCTGQGKNGNPFIYTLGPTQETE